jgi:hypothetical protein
LRLAVASHQLPYIDVLQSIEARRVYRRLWGNRHMLKFVFAILLLLWFPSTSCAAAGGLSLGVILPQNPSKISYSKIYAIEVNCQIRDDLPSNSTSTLTKIFLNTDKIAVSHIVVISSAPTAGFSLASAIPNATLTTYAYSLDQGTGTKFINNQCSSGVIVTNSTGLTITALNSYTKTAGASQIATIFPNVITTLTNLAPLITGKPLNKDTSQDLTDVNGALTPLGQIVTSFDPSRSIVDQRSYTLSVGTTTITTDYSAITVNVREVPSVVLDREQYRAALESAITNANLVKPGDTNLVGDCQLVATRLAVSGYRDLQDQAFGMIYAGGVAATTPEQMASCLGKTYGYVAVNMGDAAWSDTPAPLRVTRELADSFYPPDPPIVQPSYASISGPLNRAVQILGGYAKTPSPTTNQLNILGSLVSSNLSVDNTYDLQIGQVPPGYPAAINYLVNNGYCHFGFYAQTTSAMQSTYGAVAGILAIKAPVAATSASVHDTVVLYPIYKRRVISKFIVSNNLDEISSFVSGHTSDNGFTLTGASATGAPGVVAPAPPVAASPGGALPPSPAPASPGDVAPAPPVAAASPGGAVPASPAPASQGGVAPAPPAAAFPGGAVPASPGAASAAGVAPAPPVPAPPGAAPPRCVAAAARVE